MLKKYQIIYADPPWSYQSFDNVTASRAHKTPYRSMRMVEIFRMGISSLADDDCVLFLWATSPLLPEALHTMWCWGFEYKGVAFTWVKKNKNTDSWFWGMGSWTRNNAEYCLIGVKGKPKRLSKGIHSIVDTKLGEHSEKPLEVRERIVQLMGDLPRIELFARQKTEGWDVWGNEVKSDLSLEGIV